MSKKPRLLHPGIGVLSQMEVAQLEQSKNLQEVEVFGADLHSPGLRIKASPIVESSQKSVEAAQAGVRNDPVGEGQVAGTEEIWDHKSIPLLEIHSGDTTRVQESRLYVIFDRVIDVFFLVSVFFCVSAGLTQLNRVGQWAVESFWSGVRALGLDWWLVERNVPEVLWPMAFWTLVCVFIVQSLFVWLGGRSLGQSLVGVSRKRVGLRGRASQWALEILTLFGLFSLPLSLVLPRKVLVIFGQLTAGETLVQQQRLSR